MSAAVARHEEPLLDPAPDSTRPTRAYSAPVMNALTRDLIVALGCTPADRPDAQSYHDAARRLAEALEGEALRHAKVLAVLDLGRARACRAAASAARYAQRRFASWIKWDPPLVQKQSDLASWSETLRTACALGVDVPPPSVRSVGPAGTLAR